MQITKGRVLSKTPPLLSICIPTYNRAKYVERQLKDILAQSERFLGNGIELLISNNASLDDTDIRIKKIYSKNPKFDYILQQYNIGGEANFAFLANKAKGEFFWCVGDDDVIRPGTIEYIIDILNTWPVLGAIFLKCGGTTVLTNNETKWKDGVFEKKDQHIYDYTPEILKIYPCPDDGSGDWMFITKCIIRREAYLRLIFNKNYYGNKASTLFASCLSIKDKQFYYDNTIGCVNGGLSADNWHKHAELVCNDILTGVNNLNILGFSEYEKRCLMLSELKHIYSISILGIAEKNQSVHKAVSEYYIKKKDLFQYGPQPSLLREIKWILKYFIYKRYKMILCKILKMQEYL